VRVDRFVLASAPLALCLRAAWQADLGDLKARWLND
jgi:hypothetical protein